ncbi:hypothetical protein NJH80_25050, partial [Pseudomonas putida]|nr:hypothetical protein [Pseudomonas putida]
LKAAYQNLQKSDAPEYTAGFAASIFGVIGAAAGTLVSVRAMQKALMLRLSSTAPGMAFGNGFIRFLGSNLFARLAGYPAIFLGFFSDGFKAARQKENGDSTSAKYTLYGGISLTAGSILTLEGGLAIAGATSVIPFAGWAAAAIVLLGAAVVAGGLYLHSKAHERLHTSIELWTARSIFGNRLNDGEFRPNIILDHEKKLPLFETLREELRAWHLESYTPRLLTAKDSQLHGINNLNSGWKENDAWTPPNWTAITHNDISVSLPTVEFTVLLPGFIIGQSEWSGTLSQHSTRGATVLPLNPECHIAKSGIILYLKNKTNNHSYTTLTLNYRPNHVLDKSLEIQIQFKIER